MLLTKENLTIELDKLLPAFRARLIDYEVSYPPIPKQFQQTFIRDGETLRTVFNPGFEEYSSLFKIEFSTAPVPAQAHAQIDDNSTIRRVTLVFLGDVKLLTGASKTSRRTKFFFPRPTKSAIDVNRIVEKIKELTVSYSEGVRLRDAKLAAEKLASKQAEIEAQRLEARRKAFKESEGAREESFANLVQWLTENPIGKIESSLEGAYINLSLPNNLRVKLAFDAKRVFISEIDSPMAFDKAKINKLGDYLTALGQI